MAKNKNKRLIVRCSSMEELSEWHAKAKALGYRSTSAYVRAFMGKACETPLPGAVPFDGRLEHGDLKELSSRIRDSGKRLNQMTRLGHMRQIHSLEGAELEVTAAVGDLMRLLGQRNEEPTER